MTTRPSPACCQLLFTHPAIPFALPPPSQSPKGGNDDDDGAIPGLLSDAASSNDETDDDEREFLAPQRGQAKPGSGFATGVIAGGGCGACVDAWWMGLGVLPPHGQAKAAGAVAKPGSGSPPVQGSWGTVE